MIWWLSSISYTMTEFNSYQTATGFDEHSIAADPLFVDFENHNFHLQFNSVCIDRGLELGVAKDFDGNLRLWGAFPDIGAFEYRPGDSIHVIGCEIKNSEYKLSQNYPNPFNPTTTIRYDILKASNVTLTIYNMNGQVVDRLVNQKQEPGSYSVNWDARNISTGVYFYQIRAEGFQKVKKMLLIK